jgi:superfamily II DNA helicase RecQ
MDQYLVSQAGSKSSILSEKNKQLTEQFEQANLSIFGNEKFRSRQSDIVHAIMRGEDVFVIMPTGGGKSLCYALPAVLSQGVTVVISPLISLIEDQVTALLQLESGGIPAAYLTSACTETQLRSVDEDLKRAYDGKEPFLKLLYVTPEKMVKSCV